MVRFPNARNIHALGLVHTSALPGDDVACAAPGVVQPCRAHDFEGAGGRVS